MEAGSVAGIHQPIPPSTDHVKHRRTRSGCYTCRGRRVKVLKAPYLHCTNSADTIYDSVTRNALYAKVCLS